MRALLLLLLSLSLLARAEERLVIVVSAQSSLQSLSREALSALYMGHLQAEAHDLRPLDLPEGEVRDRFYSQLLGRSRNQMRAYWSRQVFTGRSRPPRALEETALIDALSHDPQLVAYLPERLLTPALRPVLHLP